jgi:ornithine carbamoyltransferase
LAQTCFVLCHLFHFRSISVVHGETTGRVRNRSKYTINPALMSETLDGLFLFHCLIVF